MNILFKIITICCVFVSCFADLNWGKTDDTIRNFRSFSDILEKQEINRMGVEGRYLSGSGQFSTTILKQLLPTVNAVAGEVDKIIIVDLRLESHGFVNTLPVAWKGDANLGLSVEEIIQDETTLLQDLLIAQHIEEYPVYFVATEQETVLMQNFEYERVPTLDHSHPNDQVVDAFLNLVKENPTSWVHVHCSVGRGRTTLFMAMYDMFYNAKDVSFDDIIERQKRIGRLDLKKCQKTPHKDTEKQKLYLARLAFLERFYQFCQTENLHAMTWQEWAASQPISL